MSDSDFSKWLKINSSYGRRLEELCTDGYPGKPEHERKIKPGNGEKHI